METKVINLKNNLKAKLVLNQESDYFMIFAKDDSGKVVASCKFRIVMNYARDLTETQRQIYAKRHKIKIEDAPRQVIVDLTPQKLDSYTKEEGGVKIGSNVYKHHNSYCELINIEIMDVGFHRVGLGSEMLSAVIDFAQQYNCERIDAFMHPHGEFKFSTVEFYKRNGFEVDKNNNATMSLGTAGNKKLSMER